MHIALLRGINVGSRNRVAMPELAASFAEAGARDVRTYIQSGNVLFRASERAASRIAHAVTERWRVPVVLRTAEELKSVVENNPFVAMGQSESTVHVLFLAGPVDATAKATLEDGRFAPDQVAVSAREIYFYLPNGVSGSKIFRERWDEKIRIICTMRNWRTTTKLLQLALTHR